MRSKGRSETSTFAFLALLWAPVLGLQVNALRPDAALIRSDLDAGRYQTAER